MTSEELANKIKQEILRDMVLKIVPTSARSFAVLHDYVDANCYGGTEAMFEGADTAAAVDEIYHLMNNAHTIVDAWLKGEAFLGGSKRPGGAP